MCGRVASAAAGPNAFAASLAACWQPRKRPAADTSNAAAELDWVAIDHGETEHPHTHALVRGRDGQNKKLVIARDYISHGMWARASELISFELGPRIDREIQSELDRQVGQERWTKLDLAIAREAVATDGSVGLRLFQAKNATRSRRPSLAGCARSNGSAWPRR